MAVGYTAILPFDRIQVVTDEGTTDHTISEFLELPLGVRVTAIMRNQLQFFSGDTPVDLVVGLTAMRKMATLDLV